MGNIEAIIVGALLLICSMGMLFIGAYFANRAERAEKELKLLKAKLGYPSPPENNLPSTKASQISITAPARMPKNQRQNVLSIRGNNPSKMNNLYAVVSSAKPTILKRIFNALLIGRMLRHRKAIVNHNRGEPDSP
jgi:hypothetical protein